MLKTSLSFLLLLPLLSISSTHAQDAKKPKDPRTLRILIAGKRPMPSFEQRDGKTIEVDPPLCLIPPTSFSFTNESHAPRVKAGAGRKTSYAAWANKLIRIPRYKGPNILPLKLSRPTLEPSGSGKIVNCDLGKSTSPLVLLHPSPGRTGWDTPVARVLDLEPSKVPARTLTLINLSSTPLKIYLTKKGVIVPPNKHISLKIPKHNEDAFRYKVEAATGKKLATITNSSYRIKKDSRIIMLALPGNKTKRTPFALPKLRLISDPV